MCIRDRFTDLFTAALAEVAATALTETKDACDPLSDRRESTVSYTHLDVYKRQPRATHVLIDLRVGDAAATIRTNDLTHDYVHENSAYSS